MTDIREVQRGTSDLQADRFSFGPIIFGIALMLAGLSWILDRLDVVEVKASLVIPLALVAVGVALMIGAYDGIHGGLVAAGVVLTLIVVMGSVTPLDAFRGGVGERLHNPTAIDQVDKAYRLGIGSLQVDLSEVNLTSDVVTIGELGVGELLLIVPDVPLAITAQVDAGEIIMFDEVLSGTEVANSYISAGFEQADETMTIDLDVFLGSIKVVRR
ncbi:MAG: hypothetical protein HKO03_10930 [Acidimicrobiia bacterium]|nr:hypothetical protein [Acidimicrobiia bacterium]